MTPIEIEQLTVRFAGIERVVEDPLRFKLRLGIGEDAYASLRLKKNLQGLWDIGGMAATGATVAASPMIASTFFASKGLLALVGLGAAVTPIGWVTAAAIGSAGAYYGVTRLWGRYSVSRVATIPKFINTPIDLLGATLLDMMGTLAVRLAQIDGKVDPTEVEVISRHFVTDWGFDSAYVDQAMGVFAEDVGKIGFKELAAKIATFQIDNPDCNPAAMRSELIAFLRDVAEADGLLDEREELAIEAIDAVMRNETELSFRNAGRTLTGWSGNAATTARNAVTGILRARGKPV